ncbi:hypothetical protein OESDEN_12657 [Oesophagostomum dentatum]|uniref:Uncharacterized protein n=1 Tax=Oesophagostomum dentatum TaxID=61180 RepID=A0A0B1SVM9_OESDE|nr:hypothetical protein OESDEN_12657 [Oesophagostomum dentatum]
MLRPRNLRVWKLLRRHGYLSPRNLSEVADVAVSPNQKPSRQTADFLANDYTKDASPKTNGHPRANKFLANDSKSDFDSSSGTSDGSLNATHGTKNLEDSISIILGKPHVTGRGAATPQIAKPAINYPKFHFPQGIPVSTVENDAALRRVCKVFKEFPDEQVVFLPSFPLTTHLAYLAINLFFCTPEWNEVFQGGEEVLCESYGY